jgi:hypothetical protein
MNKQELKPDKVWRVIRGKTVVDVAASTKQDQLIGVAPRIKIVFTDNTALHVESEIINSELRLRYYYLDELDRCVKKGESHE